MSMRASDTSVPAPDEGLGVSGIPGVLDRETLSHLIEVELARARRYEHPFSLVRVSVSDGRPDLLRQSAGALRLHTRWADSVGVYEGGSLLVILRDTAAPAAHAAAVKIDAAVREELGTAVPGLQLEISAWRKGDDRERMLARFRPLARGN